jgi:hypothetical protein
MIPADVCNQVRWVFPGIRQPSAADLVAEIPGARNSENQVSIREERRQSVRVDLADLRPLDPAWMVFQVEYYGFFRWVIWVWRLAVYRKWLAELGLDSDGSFFEERLRYRKRVAVGHQATSEEHGHGVLEVTQVSVL